MQKELLRFLPCLWNYGRLGQPEYWHWYNLLILLRLHQFLLVLNYVCVCYVLYSFIPGRSMYPTPQGSLVVVPWGRLNNSISTPSCKDTRVLSLQTVNDTSYGKRDFAGMKDLEMGLLSCIIQVGPICDHKNSCKIEGRRSKEEAENTMMDARAWSDVREGSRVKVRR